MVYNVFVNYLLYECKRRHRKLQYRCWYANNSHQYPQIVILCGLQILRFVWSWTSWGTQCNAIFGYNKIRWKDHYRIGLFRMIRFRSRDISNLSIFHLFRYVDRGRVWIIRLKTTIHKNCISLNLNNAKFAPIYIVVSRTHGWNENVLPGSSTTPGGDTLLNSRQFLHKGRLDSESESTTNYTDMKAVRPKFWWW